MKCVARGMGWQAPKTRRRAGNALLGCVDVADSPATMAEVRVGGLPMPACSGRGPGAPQGCRRTVQSCRLLGNRPAAQRRPASLGRSAPCSDRPPWRLLVSG